MALNLAPIPRVLTLGEQRVAATDPRERIDGTFPAQGYELQIGPDGVDLVAGDAAGLFYGHATLQQLRRVHDGKLPCGTVRDHPDLAVRGVMLDLSRDKVPTMATLRALVDRLASWKVNHLQLYTEHTFAYRDHPEVHAAASPLTAAEILELDELCRARHIELVPNQNCLGHMNRWLCHDRYRPLAVAPDGFVDPFGMRRPPMTLEPRDPASLELVRSLLAELLPLFSSRRVHVGLDEAWELPRARVDDYLAWMAALRQAPELREREMLVWGDMVSGQPDLLARLPSGVTVCEWGYDDSYPFDERTAALAGAGVPFWVAPGTSSWLSILGRLSNATSTCQNAMRAALAHGACGWLITDWGDQGHLQQLPISEPGLLYGACVAWCLETNSGIDLADALSTHAFSDPGGGLADALLTLGDAHLSLVPQVPNMATLVLHLYFPQITLGRGITRGVSADQYDAVDEVLAHARRALARSRSARPDAGLLEEEIAWSIDLVEMLTSDARHRLAGDGSLSSVPAPARDRLASTLEGLIVRYRRIWNERNRPGGLDDSARWLENLLASYRSGKPDPTWGGLSLIARP
ncbi:MAG: hypothetical protein NVSMB12_12800 [Acidimicrobiales bacterium]